MEVDPSKIHLIPMGINPDDWEDVDGGRFRRKHGLEGRKILLFAGTKDYNKGAIHLLQAVKKMDQDRKDATLVAMGLATEGWERNKRRIGEINLLDLGYVSEREKRDAFAACDLFVMPSRYDSFGIVYLEAWKCGKPVIGARVGAIPEVIEEGKDGLLVEFGNIDQLASSLVHLLDQPALCREMGETGRKKVIERYNWHTNIAMIEKVYEQVRP